MNLQRAFDPAAGSPSVAMTPASEYSQGVLQALTEILNEAFERYTADFEIYCRDSVATSALLARGFNLVLVPQRLNFLKNEALAFKQSPDTARLDQLGAFDLKKLKDYLIAKGFFESEFFTTLGFGDTDWSDEEAKYVALLFVMILGSGDAISVYFLLAAIDRHLSEHGLKINQRKYLFVAGLNNMPTLFSLKEVHSRSKTVFRIEHLFEVFYEKKRSQNAAQGCPFVLYKMPAVNTFLDVLDQLFEKIFKAQPDTRCPNAFGHELMSAKPLLSAARFDFDREILLQSEFVSELK